MLLSLLLWACDSDVSIIKRLDEETGQSIGVGEPGEPAAIVGQPTNEVGSQPSSEVGSEPAYEQQRAGVTGLSTMYLRQIACPACMGETQELTVEYELQVHQPVSDSWNSWMKSSSSIIKTKTKSIITNDLSSFSKIASFNLISTNFIFPRN